MHRDAKTFSNVPVSSIEQACEKAQWHLKKGADVYFGCAEFSTNGTRKADNAVSASAFWLDIDCGQDKAAAGKGYLDVAEAQVAVSNFCGEAELPEPTHLVNSGGGLHAYWALSSAVDAQEWIALARQFKDLTQRLCLMADPSRTADIASVLRLPGTLNFKYDPPREVELIASTALLIDRDLILGAIRDAHIKHCAVVHVPAATSLTSPQPSTPPVVARPDIAQLKSALKVLDPDCDEGTWKLRRLAPLAHAARCRPELGGELKQLAHDWSSGDLRGQPANAWITPGATNGRTGQAVFNETWDRLLQSDYRGKPATLGTIYRDAAMAGWQRPAQEDFLVTDVADDVNTDDAAIDAVDQVVRDLIEAVKKDVGAPLEPHNTAALAELSSRRPAEYQRVRLMLKSANSKVSLTSVDAAVKAMLCSMDIPSTHHGFAKSLIRSLTVGKHAPVSQHDKIYLVNPTTQLWEPKEMAVLERLVAEAHDGGENCSRGSDYRAVSHHALSLVSDELFFPSAPVGIACPGGFFRVTAQGIVKEELTADHRQRVRLACTPKPMETPRFNKFLEETFSSPVEDEARQQVCLLQEIAGATMLGVMHRFQKAALFLDPYGRAGKGTVERMLRSLVPAEYVTAVSPFTWDQPYFVASLAGARLNVVGELPDNQSIPAAMFKSVIGGDLITGRHPTHRPIKFTNEAAHLFMSNHFITSRDQSEAFFARWLILEFPNSRLRSGLPLDPLLADKIVEHELPGIAQWALEGGARLLQNGQFSSSIAHDRLMQRWRRANSSLEEFIFDDCELGSGLYVHRSTLYEAYRRWCDDTGRKPFAKSRVKELLEHNVGLGVTWAKLNGYEIFRGLRICPDAAQKSDVPVTS
ncbi:MAG: phage/plasmid primase, P4 family [Betaproteobacteria bacterium]